VSASFRSSMSESVGSLIGITGRKSFQTINATELLFELCMRGRRQWLRLG
jgi:hypothetical protein